MSASRMPARLQAGDEVREVRHRAQAIGQFAADAVEIRTDADVVDADQLHGVVDLVEHRIDRASPAPDAPSPTPLSNASIALRRLAGGLQRRVALVEIVDRAEMRLRVGGALRVDEGDAERDLHHAALRRDRLRQFVADVALEVRA